MVIKYTALLLLAFTCTHNTYSCSGPGPVEIVMAAGIIAGAKIGALTVLSSPLINAKRLGFKRNLSDKNMVLSSAIGGAASMALAIGGAICYDRPNKKYYFSCPQAEDNMFPCFVAAAALTTAYNIYQCTKEEPKEPYKDPRLPNSLSADIAPPLPQ